MLYIAGRLDKRKLHIRSDHFQSLALHCACSQITTTFELLGKKLVLIIMVLIALLVLLAITCHNECINATINASLCAYTSFCQEGNKLPASTRACSLLCSTDYPYAKVLCKFAASSATFRLLVSNYV